MNAMIKPIMSTITKLITECITSEKKLSKFDEAYSFADFACIDIMLRYRHGNGVNTFLKHFNACCYSVTRLRSAYAVESLDYLYEMIFSDYEAGHSFLMSISYILLEDLVEPEGTFNNFLRVNNFLESERSWQSAVTY